MLKFSPEHHDDLLSISKTLSQSNRPQANRIARKLEDYRGEVDQIQSLQKEIAKLQIAFNEKAIKTQMQEEMDLELKAASHQLFEILQDEDDAITSIMLIDEMENRILLTLLGVKLH